MARPKDRRLPRVYVAVPWKYELPDPKSIRETVIEESKKNEPQADDMLW